MNYSIFCSFSQEFWTLFHRCLEINRIAGVIAKVLCIDFYCHFECSKKGTSILGWGIFWLDRAVLQRSHIAFCQDGLDETMLG